MNLPLIERAKTYEKSIAIVANEGVFTYQDLLDTSAQIATLLLDGKEDLREQRVAFLIPSGFQYVTSLWAIWRAGGIATPLCVSHPQPELEYVIADSGASIIIAHPDFADLLRPIAIERGLRFILTSDRIFTDICLLPQVSLTRRALILYTSGTTSKPKGVVTLHQNIQAQVTSLVSAWEWTSKDRILHVLPLHHIHGIINVLICALWAGAECLMLTKFDVKIVWEHIINSNLTLFMGVPTIYVKLINAWESADLELQERMSQGCAQMRLMVSGSAALPVQVLEKWQNISGHFLLERYGMTEIGMALSNPLHGERLAGYVGKPLPGVEVRLIDESGNLVVDHIPGEVQVKGGGVFLEYWQKPEATAASFRDGWFATGDLAVVENDSYRLLGRLSVDIIKTGGYKVSALEIESVLRNHPMILDCAVVGVPNLEWGEQVCAVLVLVTGGDLSLELLRIWGKERLAVYKVPSLMVVVNELPRNAMGKVSKPELIRGLEDGSLVKVSNY